MFDELSVEDIDIMKHALGMNNKSIDRRKRNYIPYRNYFLASQGHHGWVHLETMTKKGFMAIGKTPRFCHRDDIVYYVTEKGLDFLSKIFGIEIMEEI